MNIFNNRIVQILLIACVIIAICIIAGLQFHVGAGSQGINFGVDRNK